MDEFREQTDQQIAEKEWLTKFDFHLPKFEWFLQDYFHYLEPPLLEYLKAKRKEESVEEMKKALNYAWFHLPDSKFNIKENPKGWREFLSLLEE